jgi:hypothetical protein
MTPEAVKNNRQPPRHGVTRRKFDGAASQADQAVIGTEFDHAEAGVLGAAIDAQDAHERKFIPV